MNGKRHAQRNANGSVKRLLACVLSFALVFCIGVPTLFAAPDLTLTGSIRVHLHTTDAIDAPNAKIELYLVAEWNTADDPEHFLLTPDFAASGVSLSHVSDPALPEALETHAQTCTPYAQGVTDAGGVVLFSDLPAGLYLVRQNGFVGTPKFSQVQSFLVSVPITIDHVWVYDVEAEPKVEKLPEIAPVTPPPHIGDKLPQTGLQIIPVLLIASCGMLLCAVGWALLAGAKRAKKEKRDA